MELRGRRRAKKPQSGFFSRHYSNGRVVSNIFPATSAAGEIRLRSRSAERGRPKGGPFLHSGDSFPLKRGCAAGEFCLSGMERSRQAFIYENQEKALKEFDRAKRMRFG